MMDQQEELVVALYMIRSWGSSACLHCSTAISTSFFFLSFSFYFSQDGWLRLMDALMILCRVDPQSLLYVQGIDTIRGKRGLYCCMGHHCTSLLGICGYIYCVWVYACAEAGRWNAIQFLLSNLAAVCCCCVILLIWINNVTLYVYLSMYAHRFFCLWYIYMFITQ